MPSSNYTAHDVSVDALLKVLADPCRRTVLSYFRTKDTDVATLEELAKYVQKHVEVGTSPQHARIMLVHQHLPNLADHRLIEYDQQSQTVRYWGSTASDAILELDS